MSRIGVLVRLVVGGIAGLVVGAIAAVNVAIAFGTDRGYEASIGELFTENPLVGVVVVAVLVAGPIAGAIVALRIRPPPSGLLPR